MTLHNFTRSIQVSGAVALIALCAGIGAIPRSAIAAVPGTVDLLATPPGLTSSVSPNLMLTLDDSGSMGRNYMPDQRPYGGGGWGANDQQNTSSSQNYGSGAGPYLCAGLIDPRITDPANPRSRAMNGVYYNPNATYRPPLLADGVTEMPNASFSAAWDNGINVNRPNSPASSSTRNLGTNSRFCGNTAGYYQLVTGVALPVDSNDQFTAAAVADIYTASNWEWVALPASERQNFANWYSYYHTRHLAAKSAISRAFAPFDESIRVAWQNINSNQIGNTTAIFKFKNLPINTNVRNRFYDWLFATPVSGSTPNQAATERVGQFFTRSNAGSDRNPYYDRDLGRELSCRQNFHINMSDGFWNGGTLSPSPTDTSPASQTLPDGRVYSTADAESKIFSNEENPSQRNMADIAWKYWATDLRPDFMGDPDTALKVPPYIPDRSTSLFGPPLAAGDNVLDNKEIYWNPANDPATWPHLVQFMIGFGISGTIPRSDVSLQSLRENTQQWPALLGSGSYSDTAEKMDDTWHAAINSRGKFFAASNPEELITALTEIISSIVARRGASTAMSVSLPLITDGTTGYTAGYDTTDWSGYLTRNTLDPATGEAIAVEWDASCILTGGPCPSAPLAPPSTPRDPDSRVMITSDGLPTSGKPFRWGSLSASQRARLNVDPASLRLDLSPQVIVPDVYGAQRLDYVRGDRTHESTSLPRFRQRSSVMGAVIKGEPEYVSSPVTGHRDIFPVGSPEEAAFSTNSYAQYQYDNRDRAPTVYVAANDGTLHAFNASNGAERWAYVPNIVIENFNLLKSTRSDSGLTPTVDEKPQQFDAFLGGAWKTVLVGSTRLGGRGVYALDVTDPTPANESTAAAIPLWEFSNVPPASGAGTDCTAGARYCSSLGYTYDSVNFARIGYQNKWVALVSSGYFPIDPLDPSSNDTAASRTSLLVIDLETGQLIREIRTSTAPQATPSGFRTFGLSTPVTYDFGSNQIDDIAIAGDLAGNLWRFDFSDDTDPANWTVDLMFTTYGSGGATTAGDQPISFNPTALRDPITRGPIYIVGTGKYIGLPDRTSLIPEQAYYGIRDYGTASVNYPIRVNQLVTQDLVQDSDGVRTIPVANSVPDTSRGWRVRLDIASEPGERAERRAFPLFSSNRALLYTLIPRGEDPCNPGARYGIMVVDGGSGAAGGDGASYGSGLVGAVINTDTPPSNPVTTVGGGGIRIIGLPPSLPPIVGDVFNGSGGPLSDDVWHRGAWRELLDVR